MYWYLAIIPRVIFQTCPKDTTNRETASGIWIILKYHEPVLLPNTTFRSYYYLSMTEAKKFSVTHKRFLFRYGWKTQTCTGVCIRNNLFTSMKNKKIDGFLWKPVQTMEGKQHEIVQWKYFEITAFCKFRQKFARDSRSVV